MCESNCMSWECCGRLTPRRFSASELHRQGRSSWKVSLARGYHPPPSRRPMKCSFGISRRRERDIRRRRMPVRCRPAVSGQARKVIEGRGPKIDEVKDHRRPEISRARLDIDHSAPHKSSRAAPSTPLNPGAIGNETHEIAVFRQLPVDNHHCRRTLPRDKDQARASPVDH
jgi:hypothetical protein